MPHAAADCEYNTHFGGLVHAATISVREVQASTLRKHLLARYLSKYREPTSRMRGGSVNTSASLHNNLGNLKVAVCQQ